jgi:lysyl-tRNA synthetase, class II
MADLDNKHIDDVTGEKVSKTELKKRQKQRQKEAEKAQKLASRPAPAHKKASAETDESELNPNVRPHISLIKMLD